MNSEKCNNTQISAVVMILIILLWGVSYPIANVLAKDELGASNTGGEKSSNDVQQVHISLGATASEMYVMWSSMQKSTPTVVYGEHVSKLTSTSKAKSRHFTDLNKRGTPFLFRAVLTSLLPYTKYFYQIQGDTNIYSFTTMKNGYDWGPKFLVYGDLGVHTPSLPQLIKAARSDNYTSIMHLGDMAYELHRGDGAVGDEFMNNIQPMASSVPYMTCPGDHEKVGTFIHYRYRFSMPGTEWPSTMSNMWYTFTAGTVRVISISTEVYFHPATKQHADLQHQWLIDTLTKANKERARHPWVIVIGHRPLYCSTLFPNEDCSKKKSRVRTDLEPLFRDAGVDMYLSGHSHDYERLWPTYNGQVVKRNYINIKVPVLVTCGSMGNYVLTETFNPKQPPWSAKRISEEDKEMYCVLDAVNHTHISWSAVDARTREIVDHIWLVNSAKSKRSSVPFAHPRNFAAGIKKHLIINEGYGYVLFLVIIFVALISVTILRRQMISCVLNVERKLFSSGVRYQPRLDV